jgi:membrane associated rhomboid family serine protease/Zn-finger nucleic acid-binding protein
MLPCPRCSVPVTTHTVTGAVYFICPKCEGRMGNLALLRRTLEPDVVNRLWRKVCDAHPTDHHGILRCPSCRGRMHPAGVPCADGAEVQLDVCRVCQIVWFDAGEIERLPSQAPPKPPPKPGRFTPEAAEVLAPMLAEHERGSSEQKWDEGSWRPMQNAPTSPLHTLLTYFGFPIEDGAPAVRTKPWITWTTAAICALVTLGAMLAGGLDRLVTDHGFMPADPLRNGGLTLISSFFIHAGILHLVFNLWFLILAGDNCEDLLGAKRYLLLLGGGALIGLLCHAAFDPRKEIPVVGASGGISALLAYYALALPHVRLVVCMRFGWWPWWFRIRASTAMVLWVLGQIIGAALQLGGLSQVSSIAHLGGALAGVIAWWVFKRGPQTALSAR